MKITLTFILITAYAIAALYLLFDLLGISIGVRLSGHVYDVELFGPVKAICLIIFIALTCAGLYYLPQSIRAIK